MVKIYQNGVKMQHIRGACNMKCNTETALKKQKAPDYSGALFLIQVTWHDVLSRIYIPAGVL